MFSPNWDNLTKGARLALVIDSLVHTGNTMVGVTVPGCKQVRILGLIDPSIKGCRRITLFNAVLENPGRILDLHLDEQSAVIAHALMLRDFT